MLKQESQRKVTPLLFLLGLEKASKSTGGLMKKMVKVNPFHFCLPGL